MKLIPKILHVGIGCRKGASDYVIRDAIKTVLAQYEIDIKAVKCVASIDLKADEEGLLKYCKDNGLIPIFYSTAELRKFRESSQPLSLCKVLQVWTMYVNEPH